MGLIESLIPKSTRVTGAIANGNISNKPDSMAVHNFYGHQIFVVELLRFLAKAWYLILFQNPAC
jgi:hypothetical protein